MCFNIKLKPSFTYYLNHLFNLTSNSHYLSQDLKNVIDPNIQRKASFAALESVLLSMLCDERKIQTELCLRRLLLARRGEVRKFKVPKIKFDAITWPKCNGLKMKQLNPPCQNMFSLTISINL